MCAGDPLCLTRVLHVKGFFKKGYAVLTDELASVGIWGRGRCLCISILEQQLEFQ